MSFKITSNSIGLLKKFTNSGSIFPLLFLSSEPELKEAKAMTGELLIYPYHLNQRARSKA
jgi:hypothetical protein